MTNVTFIGMPASGKSTIGIVVAKRLGYDFIDTDLLIQKQENELLEELIHRHGREGFLEIENQVNKSICPTRSVISPGGSVIYCEEAMKHFKSIGKIVYLQVDLKEIQQRIPDLKKRGVVVREGQTLEALYKERKVLFLKYADIIIKADGRSQSETVGDVLKALE